MNTRQKIFGAMAMLGAVTVLTTSDAEAGCNQANAFISLLARAFRPLPSPLRPDRPEAGEIPTTDRLRAHFPGGAGGLRTCAVTESDAEDGPACGRSVRTSRAAAGKTATTPMLWIYTGNDSYFNPGLAAAMYQAFTRAGGKAELVTPSVYGDDGHHLFFGRRGSDTWGGAVEAFIKKIDSNEHLVGLGGGVPVDLTSGIWPLAVAVDGPTLYWTDLKAASVMKVGTDGSSPTVVASGQGGINGITVDATNLYWTTDGSGAVMTMAK